MKSIHRARKGARIGALTAVAAALVLASGATPSNAADAGDSWWSSVERPSVGATASAGTIAAQSTVTSLATPGALAQSCSDALDGEGSLDPRLLQACMLVTADDPSTPFNDSSILWFAAQMSGPTADDHVAEIFLDTNGDAVDDLYVGSPAGMVDVDTDDPYLSSIERQTAGTWQATGQSAAWWRVSAEVAGWDGYFVGLDWRALKLSKVRFAFQVSVDENNWAAVPAGGYQGGLVTLPALATAPRNVSAVAGDRRATVKWIAPASQGGARITGYTVSSVPGGRTCAATKTSCVVTGLSNQTAYRFRVVAKTAAGYSAWSTLSAPVVPKPYTSVTVKAKSKASKLKVDVNPNKGSGYWTFAVQKRAAGGTWSNVGSYQTKGKKETRTINLPKGTYRVVVAAKYGYQTTTSGSVYLKK